MSDEFKAQNGQCFDQASPGNFLPSGLLTVLVEQMSDQEAPLPAFSA